LPSLRADESELGDLEEPFNNQKIDWLQSEIKQKQEL